MSFVCVHCYLLTGGILHGKGIRTEVMQMNSLQLQGYNQDGCPNHITIQYRITKTNHYGMLLQNLSNPIPPL